MFFLLFSSFAASWLDSKGQKVNVLSEDEVSQFHSKRRLQSVSPTSTTQLDNFTFFDFYTVPFDYQASGRYGIYRLVDVETMAMWYGHGIGPYLSRYYTYTSADNDTAIELSGINTALYLDTYTLWIFPTSTKRIEFGQSTAPIWGAYLAIAIVIIIIELIANFTKFDLARMLCNCCNKPTVVHKHRSHHHNWRPPPEKHDIPPPPGAHSTLGASLDEDIPPPPGATSYVPPPPPPPTTNTTSYVPPPPPPPSSSISPADDPYAADPYATASPAAAPPPPSAPSQFTPYSDQKADDPYATPYDDRKPPTSADPADDW